MPTGIFIDRPNKVWTQCSSGRIRPPLREISACALAEELLPVAERGLKDNGVEKEEVHSMLNIIRDRVERRINGSRWQIDRLMQYEQKGDSRPKALGRMLEDYLIAAQTGAPISQWSLKLP